MRRFENPAAFLSGLVLRAASTQRAVMRKVLVAPLATMTDDMAARLRQDNRLTGKRIGGHLCVVATPKN